MRHLVAMAAVLCSTHEASFAADISSVENSDIVSTSSQDDLCHIEDKLQDLDANESKGTRNFLDHIRNSAGPNGASNVFLVGAATWHDAVRASTNVFFGAHSANTPAPVGAPRKNPGGFWLVAYLGSAHSDPLPWVIDNATVKDKKIRLAYHNSKSITASRDIVPYYYWIPLGKLESGVYELELYDADQEAVTLMRRVTVKDGSK